MTHLYVMCIWDMMSNFFTWDVVVVHYYEKAFKRLCVYAEVRMFIWDLMSDSFIWDVTHSCR